MLFRSHKRSSDSLSVLLSLMLGLLPLINLGCGPLTNETILSTHTETRWEHHNASPLDRSTCIASFDAQSRKITVQTSGQCTVEMQRIQVKTDEVKRELNDTATVYLTSGVITTALSLMLILQPLVMPGKPEEGGEANMIDGIIQGLGAITFPAGVTLMLPYFIARANTGKDTITDEISDAPFIEEIPCGESIVLQNQRVKVKAYIENQLVSDFDTATDIDGTFTIDDASFHLDPSLAPETEVQLEVESQGIDPCTAQVPLSDLLPHATDQAIIDESASVSPTEN